MIHYLFHFIKTVSEHSNVNQMNDSNLAIVFSPNLLRPKHEVPIGALADTPFVLSLVRELINNYSFYFSN